MENTGNPSCFETDCNGAKEMDGSVRGKKKNQVLAKQTGRPKYNQEKPQSAEVIHTCNSSVGEARVDRFWELTS